MNTEDRGVTRSNLLHLSLFDVLKKFDNYFQQIFMSKLLHQMEKKNQEEMLSVTNTSCNEFSSAENHTKI